MKSKNILFLHSSFMAIFQVTLLTFPIKEIIRYVTCIGERFVGQVALPIPVILRDKVTEGFKTLLASIHFNSFLKLINSICIVKSGQVLSVHQLYLGDRLSKRLYLGDRLPKELYLGGRPFKELQLGDRLSKDQDRDFSVQRNPSLFFVQSLDTE